MGDIDDFFAKKDKKKKGGKKFSKANTDVIAKNLIETDKKELKEQEKELGSQYSEEKPISAQNSHEDEEWDDYIENKKDFSGLKIETLTIEDQAPVEEEEETEINEDGEVVVKNKSESGPWNKIGGSTNTEPAQDLIKEPEPNLKTPNVVGGSYVPPHMRGGGGSSPAPTEQPVRRSNRRGNQAAPDITNEMFFPSLSSAVEDAGPKGAWGKPRAEVGGGSFEAVRDRGVQGYARQTEAPRLALGNKFAALRDGD